MLMQKPPLQITESLTMLGTTEYPLYLVRSDGEAAVFEGGVGAMGPVLKRQLADLDLPAGSVKQILVTHAHFDHVMAVPLFRELFPQATVAASKTAAGTLSNEKAISFFAKIDQAITESLVGMGSIGEEDRPEPLAEPRIAVDRTLAEGDVVTVGALSFNVLETPGHSDCSLSFHDPRSGILFVSDAMGYYLPDHDYIWPVYFTDYATYLDSIRRLEALGAETLCLSHNAAVRGVEDVRIFFDKAISATDAYHQLILEDTRSGKSAREIAERLGAEVHEKKPLLPLDFFQKNCSLLVKLSLKHEGMLEEK